MGSSRTFSEATWTILDPQNLASPERLQSLVTLVVYSVQSSVVNPGSKPGSPTVGPNCHCHTTDGSARGDAEVALSRGRWPLENGGGSGSPSRQDPHHLPETNGTGIYCFKTPHFPN